MVSFPYYSHIFGDSYGSGMGIVWEAYYKGVPLSGVPENPIDSDVFLPPTIFGSRCSRQSIATCSHRLGIPPKR